MVDSKECLTIETNNYPVGCWVRCFFLDTNFSRYLWSKGGGSFLSRSEHGGCLLKMFFRLEVSSMLIKLILLFFSDLCCHQSNHRIIHHHHVINHCFDKGFQNSYVYQKVHTRTLASNCPKKEHLDIDKNAKEIRKNGFYLTSKTRQLVLHVAMYVPEIRQHP